MPGLQEQHMDLYSAAYSAHWAGRGLAVWVELHRVPIQWI